MATKLSAVQRRQMQQVVAKIDAKMLKEIVSGVISDIREGKWPDHEVVISNPFGSLNVGQIKAQEGWSTNPLILENMIASTVGRLTRIAFSEMGIEINQLRQKDLEFAAQLLNETTAAEAQALRLLAN